MMRLAAPVREALAAGVPVVALESTVLTHGLPRPSNLALGRRLEAVVRQAGAVPATVAVLSGELVVGLDDDEMAHLAERPAAKASLWNLAGLVAQGADAGTTVAATLHAAARSGIRVFATGGLGGVHREPYDESADVAALAREEVVTVCAGPKSLLDASATLERLETAGVAVVGWRSDTLAGFLSSLTDLPLPIRVDHVDEVAHIARAQRSLGLPGAVVVSRPVEDGLDPARVDGWVAEAAEDAARSGIRGRDLTPFMLQRLAELSHDATVEVNLRLLEANARLAAEIAVALGPYGSAQATNHDVKARGAAVPGGTA